MKNTELAELKSNLENALNLHNKMKNSYFRSPPMSASSRRNYENYNSFSYTFDYKGDSYEIDLTTECSCRHIYYKGRFYKNGYTRDVRIIKNILKDLEK